MRAVVSAFLVAALFPCSDGLIWAQGTGRTAGRPSEWQLNRHGLYQRRPVLVVVMDGIGWGHRDAGDAVHQAHTPTLDRLWKTHPTVKLQTHGKLVGLPSDGDMGNSEVGHNALGAGRVFPQGAKLVDNAVTGGSLFSGATWRKMTQRCRERDSTMHFVGLLSDGNVHSNIEHLIAMLGQCNAEGIKKVRVHTLLDGRDVDPQSALTYLERLESELAQLNTRSDRDYRIASGGGRMQTTMDRYEADWGMVERGWNAQVHGRAKRRFESAEQAVRAMRREKPEISDQDLEPFVITQAGQPVGRIEDGDSVVLTNFRGDRALEVSRAFEQGSDFAGFDRGRRPDVLYAGMMQYDGDEKIPPHYLVDPPAITRTMGEYLARNGEQQFAISETQKFGHVTYFWNGNRSGKFDERLETYVEIPSDTVPFNQRPEMRAREIADETLRLIATGKYGFGRINFANGDMVGHTGDLAATIQAVEAVDRQVERLVEGMAKAGGAIILTADHGNADQMYKLKNGQPVLDAQGRPLARTAHSLNLVPLTIVDPANQQGKPRYELDPSVKQPGLSNVAATGLWLMGYDRPEGYDPPLIRPAR